METQNKPLQVLLNLYSSRPDLQESYPEVVNDELQLLINWAASAAAGALEDSARPMLQPHAAWYAQHAFNYRPPIAWDIVTETCSLAANPESVTASVNSVAACDDDISEHLSILSLLVIEFRLEHIVELGTRTGNSSLTLLAAAKSVGGRVLSMDIQPCELAQERVAAAGLAEHWTFRNADDLSVPDSEIPELIDLLFIDTWHTYNQLTAELKKYTPRLRPGSWIAIHDYVSFPGMTRAVRDFVASRPSSLRFYPFANQNGLALIRLLG
ncbi:MAG: O-methyltransferase [Bryobacteraceae bacterium]